MSQQVTIRFYENIPDSEYESNVLSKCFDLFESLKSVLGVDNILGLPFTSNEEDLLEQIEGELGGSQMMKSHLKPLKRL